ncbi:hydratase [Vibrio sp. UCD-FRSSP16_10]|uniref:hydratase n=1 Tax=unclassified Vibrio TaxID=2614977 RepID=UPI0007FE0D4F|nr:MULTISPECIES: hydratase [unclassified Vibrio]OBT09398.1 hydratase [Vibrio sp. UCD-FRSSP16_30]OBT22077.1 hydratase [Vibrio sp. UCD-FRSSP16_10]
MTNFYSAAASELLSRRVAGTKAPRLAEDIRPTTLEEALQVQAAMIELKKNEVGGWKCLNPLAEDKYIVAPIFTDSVERGETCQFFADNGVARIEPEIGFTLGKDLPANPEGYTEAQINEAIGSCHMALELMQARFAVDSDAEFYEKLADCMVNQGLYVGPEIDREKAFDAAKVNVTVTQGDNVQTFDGVHPNQSAQSPIYWLINFMTRRGVEFKAGETIITGSYCGIVEVEFDKPTTINYEGIGEYQVVFNAKA